MLPRNRFLSILLGALCFAAATLCVYGCQSTPWSCANGIKDGVETGPDCGGGTCGACGIGVGCGVDSDCVSARCVGGLCVAAATCSDGVLDGNETDVDCGGTCVACAVGRRCARDGDCLSGVCSGSMCASPASCSDGKRDGSETGVDCGGNCPPCASQSPCNVDTDCASNLCQGRVCQSTTCHDGVKDGDESDVDCGGGTCPLCMTGQVCLAVTDCQSSQCVSGRCVPIADPCSPGLMLDDQNLCVCDPMTCGSCCDGSEGNGCGLTFQPGGNNCGTVGQACFYCDSSQLLNCEHADNGPDYCALACNAGPCGGCCSGLQNQNLHYCLHGDDDSNCGMGGALCVRCPANQHCVNGACQ